MEEEKPNDENNKKETDDLMKKIREAMGFKEKPTIPKLPINKKIQNKFLKEKKVNNSNTKNTQENNKEITKKIIYPSGITKTLIKNENNKIINEAVDYENLKPKYINNIKENIDKELIRLIENSFLLYNRRPVIRNIVKKPFSTKVLEERILLWKYLIKSFSKDEKALLIRKLLYYIGKFSERIYDEFIQIKEISLAYFKFKLKGRIYDKNNLIRNKKTDAWCEANKFYMCNSILGYDQDGNPEKEKEKESDLDREEMRAVMLMQHCSILNIKNELNGTGWGYVFLKELKELSEMYTNSAYIFDSIFYECYDIFEDENTAMFHLFKKTETVRILWNFFVDFFIDDSFVMNFLIELKFIFGVYQQDEVIKYMHDLVLYRWNIHDMLDIVKKNLEKLIGPEEIFDEKEKVEKMDNIDDVMKYIQGGEKPKKKKKKKKKNKINMINGIEDDKGCDNMNKGNNEEDFIDIDDSLSIISEADSVLDSFKNDLIEETEFNTGNKVIPTLSSEFLQKLQNNL